MGILKPLGLSLAALALATSANAAIISETYVESRSGGKNFADYLEHGGGFPNAWASSTAKSTASGTTASIGSRYNSTAGFGAWFEVSPTLPTAGATYEVYATVTSGSGAIAATTGVTTTGGTGLPASTSAFSTPGNVWNLIGTLVLDPGVNSPTIRFTETTHNNRLYADAIRFAELAPVPEPGSASLLLVAGGAIMARRRRQA